MLTTDFGKKSNRTGNRDFGYKLNKMKTVGFVTILIFGICFSFGFGLTNNLTELYRCHDPYLEKSQSFMYMCYPHPLVLPSIP